MNKDEVICCTVFGSFHKFKKEVDEAVVQFQRLGVNVLAPETGLLWNPPSMRQRVLVATGFQPLKSERGMTPREVEDRFLISMRNSDFVYLINKGGYIGTTASMELGFALAYRKPVYASNHISQRLDLGKKWPDYSDTVIVLTPEQALSDYLGRMPIIRLVGLLSKNG